MKYTQEEQALIIEVLREKVMTRLALANGHCLLGVQVLKNAILDEERIQAAGVTGSRRMAMFVLEQLRNSNLVLSKFGYSTAKDRAGRGKRRESQSIFSVEGVREDGDRGSLHVDWCWSPCKSDEGGIVSASDCG